MLLRNRRRRTGRGVAVVCLVVAVLLGSGANPAAGSGPSLDALLDRFEAMPGLSARFREEKHMALLAAPLVNEGTLHFAPPGRLVRRVKGAHPSTLLVEGGRLRLRQGGESRTMELSDRPLVHAFVESFRALLAGDREALERHFGLGFEPGGERWRLTLRPKAEALQRAIRRIRVQGRGLELERLVVEETNGDRSVTTFREVDPRRRYSEEAIQRIFRLR